MNYSLTWLADVLLAAGLKVSEQPGWRTRGGGEMGTVSGVMCHHTAGARKGNMPSLRVLIEGVVQTGGKRIPGPLAQLGLGRDGTYYIIAAGRCNHAGKGRWQDIETGNSSFIGIEAENAGTPDDPWPSIQLEAYQRGVAAILKKLGKSEQFCCGHREYALPKGRKNDPYGIDMDDFRSAVRAFMAGTATLKHPPVPAFDKLDRPSLARGSLGDPVVLLQGSLGVSVDGHFGVKTEAAVREFQRSKGLSADGIVGPRTWQELLGDKTIEQAVARPPASVSPIDRAKPLAWGQKVSEAFRVRVISICHELGVEPDYLMACIAFETGRRFSPAVVNAAGSQATGLIQFMPTTAHTLGTTTDQLKTMTAEQQLEYVRKYFLPSKGRLKSLSDVYMAILWPAAIGKLESYVLFDEKNGRAYFQNRGLDMDIDGKVTKLEATSKVQKLLDEGLLPENRFSGTQ